MSEQYGDTNGNTVATLDYRADNYAALDQFGRVLTQEWTGSSGSSVLDGYVYQYSAAGNVTGITNLTRTQGGADTANSYNYYSTDRLWAENQGSTGTYSNANVYQFGRQHGLLRVALLPQRRQFQRDLAGGQGWRRLGGDRTLRLQSVRERHGLQSDLGDRPRQAAAATRTRSCSPAAPWTR